MSTISIIFLNIQLFFDFMYSTQKYVVLGFIVILLFLALITLNKIEKPIEEITKLPRCKNDVVITTELRSKVINFAKDYIESGTGSSYFNNHYHFLNLEYSTIDCVFVVKYDYTYDSLHSSMNLKIKVFSNSNFEVIATKAFLRPVNVLVNGSEAEQLAKEHNIKYDYYNLEVDVDSQTFVYRFYKESLTEGTIVVFEVDAQSKEVRVISRPPEVIPIV